MSQEWRDETDRWILGYCWMPLGFGTLVLEDFGGGELLDVAIPTLVPLVFLLSLYFPCLCTEDIKYDHSHNRHIRGGGEEERACKVTTGLSDEDGALFFPSCAN